MADELSAVKRDLRTWQLRTTQAVKKLEAQTTARHDKASWERALAEWLAVFPDVPKPRSASVKSARAQEYFARQDRGALESDVLDAIHGAREYQFLRYGQRAKVGGGPGTHRAIDLAEIVKVDGSYADANFDLLAEVGKPLRAAK